MVSCSIIKQSGKTIEHSLIDRLPNTIVQKLGWSWQRPTTNANRFRCFAQASPMLPQYLSCIDRSQLDWLKGRRKAGGWSPSSRLIQCNVKRGPFVVGFVHEMPFVGRPMRSRSATQKRPANGSRSRHGVSGFRLYLQCPCPALWGLDFFRQTQSFDTTLRPVVGRSVWPLHPVKSCEAISSMDVSGHDGEVAWAKSMDHSFASFLRRAALLACSSHANRSRSSSPNKQSRTAGAWWGSTHGRRWTAGSNNHHRQHKHTQQGRPRTEGRGSARPQRT